MFKEDDENDVKIHQKDYAILVLKSADNGEYSLFMYYKYEKEEDLDKILFILDEANEIDRGFRRLENGL